MFAREPAHGGGWFYGKRVSPLMLTLVVVLLGVLVCSALPTRASALCAIKNPNCGWSDPKPLPRPPPPRDNAVFRWSIAQVQADGNGDVVEVNFDRTDESDTSPVTLNGCGSTAANGLQSYTWTFSDETIAPITSANCSVVWRRHLSHEFRTVDVTLTITPKTGSRFSVTHTIRYRDRVIASLGDSAASGEGAPDNPTTGAFVASRDCDRSGWAASAQAALQIQRALPDTTVHFWHLACSGATIAEEGVPFVKYRLDAGGLLNPYNSHHHNVKPPLKPQVDRLSDLMGKTGLPVDRLLITAGANDIGWATVLHDCFIVKGIGLLITPVLADFEENACIAVDDGRVRGAVRNLDVHFAKLAARLNDLMRQRRGQLGPDNIYLTQYFDPLDSLRPQPLVCAGEPLAGPYLRNWGVAVIESPLQTDLQKAAVINHWNFIDGIRKAFQGHGVCQWPPAKHWMNALLDAHVQKNPDGTWHANRVGQLHIATIIKEAISPQLS